jgi:hypothetical protein
MRGKVDRRLLSPPNPTKKDLGEGKGRCWVWQRLLNPSTKMLGRLECCTQEIAIAKSRNQAISGT